jgi:hypothetical protein
MYRAKNGELWRTNVNRARHPYVLRRRFILLRKVSDSGVAKPEGGIYEKEIPHSITALSMVAIEAASQCAIGRLIHVIRAFLC